MSQLPILIIALGLGLARPVPAHSPTPASVVEALNTPDARVALGVRRAERDEKNPRVLVVRVDPRWFAIDPGERLLQARIWRNDWRHAVGQGVVAVLDARTELPVIDYGPGGAVYLREVRVPEGAQPR